MSELSGSNYYYKPNEYVSYGSRGIYKIVDIRNESFSDKESREYYVMQSVYDERSQTFLPVDSDLVGRINRILTASEINDIIDSYEYREENWSGDAKEREFIFSRIIAQNDKKEVLRLFMSLYYHNNRLLSQKRKMYASDAKTLAFIKKMITEEYAFILGISKDNVVEYIESRIAAKSMNTDTSSAGGESDEKNSKRLPDAGKQI